MEGKKRFVRFVAVVDREERIRVPQRFLQEGQLRVGERIGVQITRGLVSDDLRRKSVTEEEIERIASVQFEDRENVIKVLRSEGSLSRAKAFRRRASLWLR